MRLDPRPEQKKNWPSNRRRRDMDDIMRLEPQPKRLRAIVEIVGGEVMIFPIADSDDERNAIFDALRIYFGEHSK